MENLTNEDLDVKSNFVQKTVKDFVAINELERNQKRLEDFSKIFLADTFETVKNNIECFSIFDFTDKTAYLALEGYVCHIKEKARKEMKFETIVEEIQGGLSINFPEEPIIQDVMYNTIDRIASQEFELADEEEVVRILMTAKVCKKMCKTACDSIFNGERMEIAKGKSQQTQDKTKTSTFDEDEQDKVIEIFNNISKNKTDMSKEWKENFELPVGYNPKMDAEADSFKIN